MIINKRTYLFRIIGIIADSLARAFIKCIKSLGAFYACKRCIVKGITKIARKIARQK